METKDTKVISIDDGKPIDLEGRVKKSPESSTITPEFRETARSYADNSEASGRLIKKLLTNYEDLESKYQKALAEIKELEEQTLTDGLTSAYNRNYFEQHINRLISKNERYGTPFSLIIYDIDHFKDVNDKEGRGHLTGDYVLKEIVKVALQETRGTDILARWGGDEFAIILPETNLSQAKEFAERLRKRVDETSFEYNGQKIPLTISLGVGQYQENEGDTHLFKRTDEALYQAKGNGRNQVATPK